MKQEWPLCQSFKNFIRAFAHIFILVPYTYWCKALYSATTQKKLRSSLMLKHQILAAKIALLHHRNKK